MSNEVEVIDVNATSNHAAMHSVIVMEQWGNGETYNEATWVERGRHAVRQTLEGMFELGRVLIVLKEHTEHGRFTEIVKEQFGIGHNETARLMAATKRFATPQMQKAQAKLMDLGKTKLLELLVEDDITLTGLADGEKIDGVGDLDDIDKMTTRELRLALREKNALLEDKDKVMSDKNRKIDELAEKLENAQRKKGSLKEPEPADVASELNMAVSSKAVAIRSHLVQLGEYFAQMSAHEQVHGLPHREAMLGAINQIEADLNLLRGQYDLPVFDVSSETPAWAKVDLPDDGTVFETE